MKDILVWLGDQHVPDHDTQSNKAVLNYLKDLKPTRIIIGGDMLDMDCLQQHEPNNIRRISRYNLRREFDAGERYLDNLQKACSNAHIDYLEGNHEYRVERWIDQHPQMEGVMEVPLQLHLEERRINWVPSWRNTQTLKVGKAEFIHGLDVNKYHSASMVSKFESNIFYGHTHDVQTTPKIAVGDHNTKVGQSLGCLCNYKQYYLKGRPTRWQQAFGVFFFREDGFFNYYVPLIYRHKFVAPNGEIYKA